MLLLSAEFGPLSEHLNISTVMQWFVNTTPPMYIGRVSPFAMVNEVPYAIEGMEGIVGTMVAKFDNDNSKSVPKTTFENNSTTTTMTVNMNADDNSRVDVKRSNCLQRTQQTGEPVSGSYQLRLSESVWSTKYQAESSSLISSILKKYNKEKDKLEQRLTQDYNQRDERLKADIESSMEVKVAEYKKFQLEKYRDGKTSEPWEFHWKILKKRRGQITFYRNPKLIEQQVEIKDKQLKRDRDIYMNYARSFINEINFTIPDGYTVEELKR